MLCAWEFVYCVCVAGRQPSPVQEMSQVTFHYFMYTMCLSGQMYCVSQKIAPPCGPAVSLTFFHKRLRIWNQYLLRTYYTFLSTLDYKFFIQLSPNLTKLCHINHDYLVHIVCSKCPPLAETHAFRRLRKSLVALFIVVCGKYGCIYIYSSGYRTGHGCS